MRCLVMLVGLALLFATSARADAATDFQTASKALDAARAKGDCMGGAVAAATIVASPSFDALSDAQKLSLWGFGADCAWKSGNLELALEDARHGTALPDAPDWLWRMRLVASVALTRPNDAADAVESIVRARPAAITTMDATILTEIVGDLVVRFQRPDIASRLLGALEAANYQAPGLNKADRLWFDFALIELAAGHADHASALMKHVTRSDLLLQARLDARFSNLVAANPGQFDVTAAMNAELAAKLAGMKEHPDSLAQVLTVSASLRSLERSDEALAVVQGALDRLAAAGPSTTAFADQKRWTYGAHRQKALILTELGRADEAVAALGEGAEASPSGGVNVAQAIDHAGFLIMAGHPAEALQGLASPVFDQAVPQLSPNQVAYVHYDRACADAMLGRSAASASELDFLAAHRDYSEEGGLAALLCADKEDAFAADMIARLADPYLRGDVLQWLCEYDVPTQYPPIEKTMNARLAAIRERPDVQAAVAKVGHTERFHLSAAVFLPF
jgi:tetratricopeptide (TPR) repeat protein